MTGLHLGTRFGGAAEIEAMGEPAERGHRRGASGRARAGGSGGFVAE